LLFGPKALGKAYEISGRANDAVTRRNDAERILSIRRPVRRSVAKLPSDLAVGASLTEWNGEERFPNYSLEIEVLSKLPLHFERNGSPASPAGSRFVGRATQSAGRP
jgi:hypothetical protein